MKCCKRLLGVKNVHKEVVFMVSLAYVQCGTVE